MARKKKTITKTERKPRFQKIKSFFGNRQTQTILGTFAVLLAVFLIISFFSYFFNWQEDQSQLADFSDKNISAKNSCQIFVLGIKFCAQLHTSE